MPIVVDSQGLLLLTNYQPLCAKLLRTRAKSSSDEAILITTSPHDEDDKDIYGSKFEKIYLVETSYRLSDKQVSTLSAGVEISTRQRRYSMAYTIYVVYL